MTISKRFNPAANLKTICNLATSKRAFMILWNPDCVQREFWQFHSCYFGFSFVYFSLQDDSMIEVLA